MQKFWIVFAALILVACKINVEAAGERPDYVILVHGGAGTLSPESITPEQADAYQSAIKAALLRAETSLLEGGSALDAITAAITGLEDDPLFNAGKGAVFTNAGTNELDAAIMDGATLNVGSVSGVTNVKNPILLARAIMENSRHVMMQGVGAEEFAIEQGLEIVDPSYFYTEHRWRDLEAAKAREEANLIPLPPHKFGTVGVVILDRDGNLAAGTSTGGLTNKRWGRVGDTPIVGAGTYASNTSCAVSGTGTGEYFIRASVARSICAKVEFEGISLVKAANDVVMRQLIEMGGDGGIIAIDRNGNTAMVFNTPGMYRGRLIAGGEPETAIYSDPPNDSQ